MIVKKWMRRIFLLAVMIFFMLVLFSFIGNAQAARQKISINDNWRFFKGDPDDAKGIFYDVRPKVTNSNDNVVADTRADQSNIVISDSGLKKWILPSANDFIKDPAKRYQCPTNNDLTFSIEGPGEIIATDSGDPTSLISFASLQRPAFNGLCLVIVQSKPNKPGTIKLKAESKTLKEATILLLTK